MISLPPDALESRAAPIKRPSRLTSRQENEAIIYNRLPAEWATKCGERPEVFHARSKRGERERETDSFTLTTVDRQSEVVFEAFAAREPAHARLALALARRSVARLHGHGSHRIAAAVSAPGPDVAVAVLRRQRGPLFVKCAPRDAPFKATAPKVGSFYYLASVAVASGVALSALALAGLDVALGARRSFRAAVALCKRKKRQVNNQRR